MTAAEKAAALAAYNTCLAMLQHHANICIDAHSLSMDLEASIRRRMCEIEASASADAPAPAQKKGKGNG